MSTSLAVVLPVGKAPQLVEVALLANSLDEHVARRGVALVGKAPQLVEVALVGSNLDELINRILVTALSTLPQCKRSESSMTRNLPLDAQVGPCEAFARTGGPHQSNVADRHRLWMTARCPTPCRVRALGLSQVRWRTAVTHHPTVNLDVRPDRLAFPRYLRPRLGRGPKPPAS